MGSIPIRDILRIEVGVILLYQIEFLSIVDKSDGLGDL